MSRGLAEGPRSSVTRYCGRRCGGLQGFEAAKGQFRRVIKRDCGQAKQCHEVLRKALRRVTRV